jgi:hypothetical protein
MLCDVDHGCACAAAVLCHAVDMGVQGQGGEAGPFAHR